MARPKQETPTAGELEVLKVLWEHGPCTVREVLNDLNKRRPRAYTSVMTLLNVMTEKRLVTRQPQGRAYVYQTRRPRETTLGRMVQDLLGRAFEGSASALVTQVLTQSKPSDEELEAIQQAIDQYHEREES
ncbi:MAG: BlaI/MecI/CopY family transcriptional regulator [Pirellulaceae bacterium]|nr:BlaI/MecI/CopY family transcriptional regulator [Pirellulaceae bacterium]